MLKWGSVEERQYQLGNKRNKSLVHTRYKDVIKFLNEIIVEKSLRRQN
jgi:hypothetical protein